MRNLTEINDTWSFSRFNKKTQKYEIVKLEYFLQFKGEKLHRIFTNQLLPVDLKSGSAPIGFLTTISPTSEIFNYFKKKYENTESLVDIIYN